MSLKKLIQISFLASTLVIPGCAQLKMGYHYINYEVGGYSDYVGNGLKSDEQRAFDKEMLEKSKLEVIKTEDDFTYVLYVQGTPYERGYQHGLRLKEQVRTTVASVNHLGELMKVKLKQHNSELIKKLKNETNEEEIAKLKRKREKDERDIYHLNNGYDLLESFIPEHFKEEMKGLADGAGVSLQAVQFYQALGDIVESHCSNYFLNEDATADGKVIQVRLLDFPLNLKVQKNPVVMVAKPNEGHAFVTVGWAGFLGTVTGLNSQRIGLGEMRGDNAVKAYRRANNLGEKVETMNGIPMPFLLRDILQYDANLEEVTNRLMFAERTNCYVYVIGDGKTGVSRAYVTDHELFEVFTSENFVEALSIVEPETEFQGREGAVFGGHNNALINELLNTHYGEINEEMIINEFNDKLAMKNNLQAVIYNLTDMVIHVANADGTTDWESNASKQNYLTIDLTNAFEWFNEHNKHSWRARNFKLRK